MMQVTQTDEIGIFTETHSDKDFASKIARVLYIGVEMSIGCMHYGIIDWTQW